MWYYARVVSAKGRTWRGRTWSRAAGLQPGMVGLQGCSAGPSVGLEVRGRLWPDPFTAPPGPCAGFGWPNPFAVPPLYQPFGPANFFPNPLKGKGLAVNPGEPRTLGCAHCVTAQCSVRVWHGVGVGGGGWGLGGGGVGRSLSALHRVRVCGKWHLGRGGDRY